ncbi:MAG: YesL family protein [Lachnospiraceae bacterium]|nr:YesL family protein [Lachnospiraceae bacterium]
MSKFFADDNPVNAVLTKVFDLCMLNIVALVCCIPIVTAGASLTAMYAVMLPMSENKEGPVIKSFFKQFIANLKGSVKMWLLILAAALVLMFDLYVWTKADSQYRSVFFGLTIAMLAALAVVASWYFALRATFEDDGKTSLINAGKYSLIYLPASILMAAYTAGVVYVYLQQGYLALFIPIFGITLIEYPKAWYMRQKFNNYIADHSDIYGVVREDAVDEAGEEVEEGERASGEAKEEEKTRISDETQGESAEGVTKVENAKADKEEKEEKTESGVEKEAVTEKEENAEVKEEAVAEKEENAEVGQRAGEEDAKAEEEIIPGEKEAAKEQISKSKAADKEKKNKKSAKGNSRKKNRKKKNKKKKRK